MPKKTYHYAYEEFGPCRLIQSVLEEYNGSDWRLVASGDINNCTGYLVFMREEEIDYGTSQDKL